MKYPACVYCHTAKADNLQVTYPAWFKMNELLGPLDATTLMEVDAGATAYVHCKHCDQISSYKEYNP